MEAISLQIKQNDADEKKQEEEEKQFIPVPSANNNTFTQNTHKTSKPKNKRDITQPLLERYINRKDILIPNIDDQFTSNKQLRDTNEIYSYLDYCLPPYMDKFSILKCIFLFFGGMFVNVIYIIYNFYSLSNDHRSNYTQHYLWWAKLVITYYEFGGVCFIFIVLMYGIIGNSKSSKSIIIDFLSYLQSWSTFKLFFIFRPELLVDYWSTCYKYSKDYSSKLNSKNADLINSLSQLQKMSQCTTDKTLKSEYEASIAKLRKIIQDNDAIEKQNENRNRTGNNDCKTFLCTRCNQAVSICIQIPSVASGLLLFSAALLLPLVGILTLIFKISRFPFSREKDIFAFTHYEWFSVFAFCNQLWSATNDNKIRIDMLYKCIYLDSIKCKYSRYIAERIQCLDAKLKEQLWNNYGFKGFLFSLQLDWSIIFKIMFKDEFDTISVHNSETIKDENKHKNDQKTDENDYNKVDNKAYKEIIADKLEHHLRLKSHWKLLHPYTKIKHTLLTYYQQQTPSELRWIVLQMHVVIFEQIKKTIIYFLPILFCCLYIYSIVLFITQYNTLQNVELRNVCPNAYKDDETNTNPNMRGHIMWTIIFQTVFMCCCIFMSKIKIITKLKHGVDGHCLCVGGVLWLIIVGSVLPMSGFQFSVASCLGLSDHSTMLTIYVGLIITFYYGCLIVIIAFVLLIIDMVFLFVIFTIALFNFVYFIVGIIYQFGIILKYLQVERECLENDWNGFTKFYVILILVAAVVLVIISIINFTYGIISNAVYSAGFTSYFDTWFHVIVASKGKTCDRCGYKISERSANTHRANVVFSVSLVLFQCTQWIYVILYYSVLRHHTATDRCDNLLSKINLASLGCFIIPYAIIFLWIFIMKQEHLSFWFSMYFNFLNSLTITPYIIGSGKDD